MEKEVFANVKTMTLSISQPGHRLRFPAFPGSLMATDRRKR